MKTKKQTTHTIIISDVHLGSSVSRAKEALQVLKSWNFRKLILLGDIFENLDFRNLPREHWEFLAYVGELSQKKKVRWVEGNHDKGLSEIFAALIGAKVYSSYQWRYKKEKYLAIHGHQFDRFLVNNIFLSYAASIVYNFIQKIDFKDKRISHFIKRRSKGWLRLSTKVANSALLYGKLKGVKYVFCGHTHKSMKKQKRGVKYYNSGCWTDVSSAYITINHKEIKIHKVD